jgi:hypothetical protein
MDDHERKRDDQVARLTDAILSGQPPDSELANDELAETIQRLRFLHQPVAVPSDLDRRLRSTLAHEFAARPRRAARRGPTRIQLAYGAVAALVALAVVTVLLTPSSPPLPGSSVDLGPLIVIVAVLILVLILFWLLYRRSRS